VFPNPSKDVINIVIHGMESGKAIVMLSDMPGKCLRSEIIHSESFQLDIASLSPGIYLLQVYTEQKKLIRKIFIERRD
jgi:hypothetical protein